MAKEQKTFKVVEGRPHVKSVDEMFELAVQAYTSEDKTQLIEKVKRGDVSKATFSNNLSDYFDKTYLHKLDPLSPFYAEVKAETDANIDKAFELFNDYTFGYGRLERLIMDGDITDIHCMDWNNVRIKKKGKRMDSGVKFSSRREFENFINNVATRNKVTISNQNAIQRFTDPHTNPDYILRFTVSTPLLNPSEKYYLVIRKVKVNFPSVDDLCNPSITNPPMMPKQIGEILKKRFVMGSTLICGANSSGKTTFLNAFKEEIPHDQSVLICQQADELTSKNHPDMFFLHELPPTSESSVSYDLKNISIMGLTMDVNYFIIGEIKGAEALYLLNAAYTGQICAGTIHANTAKTGLNKLADYALWESKYSRNELMKMLASSFKTIVHMKNFRVNQIVAVTGWDEERQDIKYTTIYQYKDTQTGRSSEDDDGKE